MSRVVHFTEHMCVLHHLDDTDGESPADRNARFSAAEREYARLWPGDRYLDRRNRHASWTGCSQWRSSNVERPLRFTMRPRQVTCKRCTVEAQKTYLTDRSSKVRAIEVIGRTWITCCRHRGAPSPLSPDDTQRALAFVESSRRLAPLNRLADSDVLQSAMTFSSSHLEMGAGLRAELEACLNAADEDLREALRPAAAEIAMASDLADEIGRMFERARAHVIATMDRIGRGELESTAAIREAA
jgi:hypothetical protein